MEPVNTRQHVAGPAAVLTGGERSVIVVAASLLGFFNTKEAAVLRTVSSEPRDAIATFLWNDLLMSLSGVYAFQTHER